MPTIRITLDHEVPEDYADLISASIDRYINRNRGNGCLSHSDFAKTLGVERNVLYSWIKSGKKHYSLNHLATVAGLTAEEHSLINAIRDFEVTLRVLKEQILSDTQKY